MSYTSPTNEIKVDNDILYRESIAITVAALQALIAANNVAPSTLYRITDSVHGGNIYVRSTSTGSVSQFATWVRNTNLKSFGAIGLRSGAGGSINSITVDGVNQMSAVVGYATSLANTTTLVANNINANPAATYRAIACHTQLVLESKTAGTAFNGKVVAGTSNIIVLGSAYNTKYGYDPTSITLNITYDINTDAMLRCNDNRNNVIEVSETIADSVYNNFRWGDPRGYNDNYISSSSHKDVFLYNDSGFYQFNEFRNSFAQNVFIAGTGGSTSFTTLKFCNVSSITNICLISSVGSAFISYSSGEIYCRLRNLTKRSASGNCGITGCSVMAYGFIYEDVSWNAGAFTLAGLQVTGYFTTINTITGTSTGSLSMFRNNLIGASSNIKSITCSSTGTYQIFGNNLSNYLSEISSISFTSGSTMGIYYCNILGQSSKINTITFNVNNAALNNINIIAPSVTFGGFNPDATLAKVNNVTWDIGSYIIEYTTPTMNNTANRGEINSPITLGYIPEKFFVTNAYVEGSGLTSETNTAQLSIGIEIDAPTAFLPATVITGINNNVLAPAGTRTKATAVRKVIATPTVEALTAGTFRIVLQGALGI